jgi:acyl-CoA reductase-like NAD-dependent aldehyde dehydrogenase
MGTAAGRAVTMSETDAALPLWLGGEPYETGTTVAVTDKWSGSPFARVAWADRQTIDRAIELSVDGFHALRAWPAWRRAAALRQVADAVEAERARFAEVLVREAGKPLQFADAEIDRALDTLRLGAEEASRIRGEHVPLDGSPRGDAYEGWVRRFPIGPCALITPFNFPLNLVCHKVAPAIAAGCSFVLKPAPATPVSALLLGEILSRAGLPPGTFSILPCSNGDAAALVEDDRLRMLSFTGSVQVGWQLREQAPRKRMTLELGGNAACIVDRDADPSFAAERIVFGAFYQAGQSCISVQRVLVHAEIYARFSEVLLERIRALRGGSPSERDTFLSPLISEAAAERVEGWIADAVQAGAQVLVGGTRRGAFLEPTVLEGVPPTSALVCEEAFGPVMTLAAFDDLDDAIARANDPHLGLQAGIFTDSLARARRAFEGLEVGGVVIGDIPSSRVDAMPYGGIRDSGTGREGVRYAIEEMTEPKLMLVRRR